MVHLDQVLKVKVTQLFPASNEKDEEKRRRKSRSGIGENDFERNVVRKDVNFCNNVQKMTRIIQLINGMDWVCFMSVRVPFPFN